MFKKIKTYFYKIKESKLLLKNILKDLEKLDHTKWYHPLIPHKECHGYGFLDKAPNDLVPNIFERCHPDLSYKFYDGPFSCYPISKDIDINKLTNKDLEKLLKYFRKKVYK